MQGLRRHFVLLWVSLVASACGGGEEPPPQPTAASDAESFMKRYFEVFDAYVLDDIVGLYAADVSANISGLGTLEGIDAVRDEWLVPFTSAFPDYTHTVDELTVEGTEAPACDLIAGAVPSP